MTGITTTETHHGNPGETRKLPAGMRVNLVAATNLPDDSEIKYWAHPLPDYPWPAETAEWAESVGVGLSDVDVDPGGYSCDLCGDVCDFGKEANWGMPDVYDNLPVGDEGHGAHEHIVCFVCADTCVPKADSNGVHFLNAEGDRKLVARQK